MRWDEAFANQYDEWSGPMTADVGFYLDEPAALYGGFAREPFADDSQEYVFVTRRRRRRDPR
jgi:hypothetical protein